MCQNFIYIFDVKSFGKTGGWVNDVKSFEKTGGGVNVENAWDKFAMSQTKLLKVEQILFIKMKNITLYTNNSKVPVV